MATAGVSSAALRKCLLYTVAVRSSNRFSTASIILTSCRSLTSFAGTSAHSFQSSVKLFHSLSSSAPSWLGVKASSLTVNTPKESTGCPICSRDLTFTYKDVLFLSQFLSPEGHMLNRRVTGVCGKQQKKLEKAVKISRRLGLLPMLGHPSSPTAKEQKRK